MYENTKGFLTDGGQFPECISGNITKPPIACCEQLNVLANARLHGGMEDRCG
jgi:hypothetical protein